MIAWRAISSRSTHPIVSARQRGAVQKVSPTNARDAEQHDSQLTALSAPHRVVIANYSGYILGDDAIFEALIARVKHVFGADVVIDALTAAPDRTRARYPVADVDHVYTYGSADESRRRVVAMLTRADLLIIGGGDIIEGQQAFFILSALARLVGTPIIYAGVGVLQPAERRRQRLLAWSANQTRYIATRDATSTHLLRSTGVTRPPIMTLPDLAVGFDTPPSELGRRILGTIGHDEMRPYVVVNVRAPDTEQYGATWGATEYAALATVCRVLIDKQGVDIVCVPFVSSATLPSGDATVSDDTLMHTLAEQINRPGHVAVLHGDYWPSEIASVIAGATLAIGMRLHFLLLAANSAVPIVALSYARKVTAFIDSIGMNEYCLDVSQVDAQTLQERVDEALSQREIVQRQLIAWREAAQSQLIVLDDTLNTFASLATKRRLSHWSFYWSARKGSGQMLAAGMLTALHGYGFVREALR